MLLHDIARDEGCAVRSLMSVGHTRPIPPWSLLTALTMWIAGVAPVLGQEPDPVERGRAIAEEADARSRGFGDYRVRMTMVLRDGRGREAQRELELWVLEVSAAEERSLVRFERPPDIRGTELLTYSYDDRDDEQWLYLPALRRAKRISATGRSSPFVGSEFAYEDLVRSSIEEYRYRFIAEEELDGVRSFVIDRYPTYEGTGYSKQRVWIDRAEYRVVRIDFWDLRGRELKTLVFRDYERYLDEFWEPGEAVMSSRVTGASTLLEWTGYQFRTDLTEGQLSRGALGRPNE